MSKFVGGLTPVWYLVLTMTIRDEIGLIVQTALEEAQEAGALPPAQGLEAAVERPQKAEHGDFASSLPLRLARQMRMSPMVIGERIAERVRVQGPISRVWTAPPGFVNLALNPGWLASQVDAIRGAGDSFGTVDIGADTRVQVEFVSLNPTGPVHAGHARGAVVGSALANVLDAAGYDVQREYYVNDARQPDGQLQPQPAGPLSPAIRPGGRDPARRLRGVVHDRPRRGDPGRGVGQVRRNGRRRCRCGDRRDRPAPHDRGDQAGHALPQRRVRRVVQRAQPLPGRPVRPCNGDDAGRGAPRREGRRDVVQVVGARETTRTRSSSGARARTPTSPPTSPTTTTSSWSVASTAS